MRSQVSWALPEVAVLGPFCASFAPLSASQFSSSSTAELSLNDHHHYYYYDDDDDQETIDDKSTPLREDRKWRRVMG